MNDEKSNTWFVGKDVARALGYVNPTKAVRVHVKEEDKLGSILDTSFGMKETIFINESGLYALVLSSKLPQARDFKHWVTSEVLPQIRQTEWEPIRQRSVTTVHIIANSIYFVKIGCPFVVGVHPYLHTVMSQDKDTTFREKSIINGVFIDTFDTICCVSTINKLPLHCTI